MSDEKINNTLPADGELEEVQIDQDHKRGPGWFLIVSYVVISAFCLYYLFTHWEWKSDYELQQQKVQSEVQD